MLLQSQHVLAILPSLWKQTAFFRHSFPTLYLLDFRFLHACYYILSFIVTNSLWTQPISSVQLYKSERTQSGKEVTLASHHGRVPEIPQRQSQWRAVARLFKRMALLCELFNDTTWCNARCRVPQYPILVLAELKLCRINCVNCM